jgi:hypothetical protein
MPGYYGRTLKRSKGAALRRTYPAYSFNHTDNTGLDFDTSILRDQTVSKPEVISPFWCRKSGKKEMDEEAQPQQTTLSAGIQADRRLWSGVLCSWNGLCYTSILIITKVEVGNGNKSGNQPQDGISL